MYKIFLQLCTSLTYQHQKVVQTLHLVHFIIIVRNILHDRQNNVHLIPVLNCTSRPIHFQRHGHKSYKHVSPSC